MSLCMRDNPRPDEIWEESADEGERRLSRDWLGTAASALVGGFDVGIGLLGLYVVSGAFATSTTPEIAHIIGSLAFAIGFVLTVLGASELFTENFLVPVAAVFQKRSSPSRLAMLWVTSLLFNALGLAIICLVFTRPGVLEPPALDAARNIASHYAERTFAAAFASAILAGAVITLLTWTAAAAASGVARMIVAFLLGFLLVAASLNHAVVSIGEMLSGIILDAPGVGWIDLLTNIGIAVFGNILGGMGLVTLARLAQARGESPESDPLRNNEVAPRPRS
jgi:formate/nitrite transporter FocA (FNT family)